MTMNCEYDSVVGVILPVDNKMLPIVHLNLKLTKTHPLFYTFCQKPVAVFLLVVKMAASLPYSNRNPHASSCNIVNI